MIPKTTNPAMPEQVLRRIKRRFDFVEGEDFVCHCPPWCTSMEPAELPKEEGWYLAISHISGLPEPTPQVEPVYVSGKGSGLVVHELGADPQNPAALNAFWWVGKIKLPEVIDLRDVPHSRE